MKKTEYFLVTVLVVTSVLTALWGVYLKFDVLESRGIKREENIMELPFLLYSDKALAYAVRGHLEAPELPKTLEPAEILPEPTATVPEISFPEPTETELSSTESTQTEPPLPLDASWFDDVLFIGDSRTVGLRDFARLGKADYFCTVGMTVFDAAQTRTQDYYFGSTTLGGLLNHKKYGKIIIGLGINECGYPLENTMGQYRWLVEWIQKKQPDTKVILQGIMTVGRNKAKQAVYFTPEKLNARNDSIATLAGELDAFYFDLNEWAADEDGYLPDEFSADGCHPLATGYETMADWILQAVEKLQIP